MPLWDRILRLFGSNRVRWDWKVRRWRASWARWRAPQVNRDQATRSARRAVDVLGVDGSLVTGGLVLANLCVFVATMLWSHQHSGDVGHGLEIGPSPHALVRFGAMFGPVADDGAWYRVLTAVFLHGGVLHLAMNLMSLWSVGRTLEELIGSRKLLALYVLLGVVSNLGSYAWSMEVAHRVPFSVGASGAICGLIGLVIGMSLRKRNVVGHLRDQYVRWALYIGLMFFIPRIDSVAHVAGFIAGIGAGLVVRRRSDTERLARGTWSIAAVVALGACVGAEAWAHQDGAVALGWLPPPRAELDGVPGRPSTRQIVKQMIDLQEQRPARARDRAASALVLYCAFNPDAVTSVPDRVADLRAAWRHAMALSPQQLFGDDDAYADDDAPPRAMPLPSLDEQLAMLDRLSTLGLRLGVAPDEVMRATDALRERIEHAP